MFDFRNYSTKSEYCHSSKKCLIRKMKDETGGVAIEELVGLKAELYFVDDNNKQKKPWM